MVPIQNNLRVSNTYFSFSEATGQAGKDIAVAIESSCCVMVGRGGGEAVGRTEIGWVTWITFEKFEN